MMKTAKKYSFFVIGASLFLLVSCSKDRFYGQEIFQAESLMFSDNFEFGKVRVGESKEFTATLSNPSSQQANGMRAEILAQKIEYAGISRFVKKFFNSNSTSFQFKGGAYPGEGGTCGPSFNEETECTVVLVFSPKVPGMNTAEMLMEFWGLTTGRQNNMKRLSGIGVPPSRLGWTMNQQAIDSIPIQGLMGKKKVQNLLLHNMGEEKVFDLNLSLDNGVVLSHSCPKELGAGESCPVQVAYNPSQKEKKKSNLKVNFKDELEALTMDTDVNLEALRPAQLVLVPTPPSPYDFGNVSLGNTQNATFTLVNQGDVAGSDIEFSVPGPFSLQKGNCGVALQAGASCEFSLSFSPTTVAGATGSLEVQYQSGLEQGTPVSLTLLLKAAGFYPAIAISSVTPNSGPTAGGTTVSVVGQNFRYVSKVQIDGVNCRSFSVDASFTSLTCVTPGGSEGSKVLEISDSFTKATSQFTYMGPPDDFCDIGTINDECYIFTVRTARKSSYIGTGNVYIQAGGELKSSQAAAVPFSLTLGTSGQNGLFQVQNGGKLSANLILNANRIEVQQNGQMSVDGLGFAGGYTSGGVDPVDGKPLSNGKAPALVSRGGEAGAMGGGGGHGRAGQNSSDTGSGGPAYDSFENPVEAGAGGGAGSYQLGGAGGGILRLTALSTIQILGTLSANGVDGATNGLSYNAGGGAGGTIYLKAPSVISANSTVMRVQGGNGGKGNYWIAGGAGAGGRIAVISTRKLSGNISVLGGLGGYNYQRANPGTFYQSNLNPCDQGHLDTGNCVVTTTTPISDNSVFKSSGDFKIQDGVSAYLVDPMGSYSFELGGDLSLGKNANLTGDISSFIAREVNVEGTIQGNLFSSSFSKITVSPLGKIMADGLGYAAGNAGTGGAPANTNGGGEQGNANIPGGGGHGGTGQDGNFPGSGGSAYDDRQNPVYGGAGGGGNYQMGGSGGGVIRLVASQSIQLFGTLSANGNPGTTNGTSYSGGGGAGGSLYLNGPVISSSPSANLSAMGGNGGKGSYWIAGGAGAGGRIAIHSSSKYAGAISVLAGLGGYNYQRGNPGTFYQSNLNPCDSGSLQGSDCIISTSTPLSNDSLLTGTGNLHITSTGKVFAVDPTTYFTIDIDGDLILDNGGTLTGNIRDLKAQNAQVGGMIVGNILNSDVNTFSLSSTGKIQADGLGYAAGNNGNGGAPAGTNGGGQTGTSTIGAGGGHGGAGQDGNTGATGGLVYDDPTNPIYGGAGGASGSYVLGGAGGGIIRLIATQSIAIVGSLTADGAAGSTNGFAYSGGGGAGGSIYLKAPALTGPATAKLSAQGGNGGKGVSVNAAGAGGGGRIALVGNNQYLGQALIAGGIGGMSSTLGNPGTFYQAP